MRETPLSMREINRIADANPVDMLFVVERIVRERMAQAWAEGAASPTTPNPYQEPLSPPPGDSGSAATVA